MDTNMEDVGRVPEGLPSAPSLEPTTIPTLDGWIESLMSCKQLAESDVQRLCEKVSFVHGRHASSCRVESFPVEATLSHYEAEPRARVLAMPLCFRLLIHHLLQAREVLQDESNVQPVVRIERSKRTVS